MKIFTTILIFTLLLGVAYWMYTSWDEWKGGSEEAATTTEENMENETMGENEDEDLENNENSTMEENQSAEVEKETLQEGDGQEATEGDTVAIDYTGQLEDGTVFDSSEGRAPLEFTIGGGQVIPGFSQGVLGMKVGGERRVTIPPELAYGEQGIPGTIPQNATLIFDVTLVEVK